MAQIDTPSPRVIGVLDMGASAIRLVVGEIVPGQPVRVLEEATRGVLLGRDTFSGGVIRPRTVDATLAALEGFRHVMDGFGVTEIRAVATSAVREARNGELFLDLVRARSGIPFDIINEAEESRLVFLAVRDALKRHAAMKAAWTLLAEVGGGSTSLTLLRHGQPLRSGLYALGGVRLRQRLDLPRYGHDLQLALLKRAIANVVEEIRLEIPLKRITHIVAVGGDVRLAAAQILEHATSAGPREIPREAFLAFCDELEPLDDESLISRFRLPGTDAETLVPSLLVHRAILAETGARRLIVSEGSLRTGVLLDLLNPGDPTRDEDFERQVLASAESLGHRYRFDRAHGRHVALLATRLFDELQADHGLSRRERLLLQTAALLHDIGVYVGLRAHHKHSEYLLAASQIFGLSGDDTRIVATIARYHRRAFPQRSHLPYVELDHGDQLLVNKLAAILRVANALDAEHLQKVRDLRLVHRDRTWILELDGSGDITMEQIAATARTDLFMQVFGREVVIRVAGGGP